MDAISSHTQHLKTDKKNSVCRQSGFTLIELLVVVIIIGVLFTALGSIFNPFAQIQKTRNANRQQDFNHIKSALDAYLNDTGCYPKSLSFGSKWAVGSTTYMVTVPQDPDCSSTNSTYCYDYQTDGSSCPQWNILYATMHTPVSKSIPTCMLSTVSGCLPSGGIFTYNYCTVSGKLDCTYLSQNPLPTPSSSGGPSGTPTPVPTSICNGQLSACSNGLCNVESASQCIGCGGSMQCYSGLTCGGVKCQ